MVRNTILFKIAQHRVAQTAFAVMLALGTSAVADAGIILNFGPTSTSSNNPPTGASGTVSLSFLDNGPNVTVTALVANTTGSIPSFGAGATAATLTGFGFDLVDGVSYAAGTFVPGLNLDTLILNAAAQPFGTLDVAGADNNNFNGGNANDGITAGNSDTFSFELTGLAAAAMETAFQLGFNADPGTLNSVMRFQQVNAGAGSDKLQYNPGTEPPPGPLVPEPASLALWTVLGLAGVAGRRRRAAKK